MEWERNEEQSRYLTKENVDVRVCVDCWIEKPICEFSKSTPKRCKGCISIRNRKYHERNKQRINNKKKEYMQNVFKVTHPNYKKEYYESHKLEISDKHKQYNEKYKAISRMSYKNNADRIKADTTERWKIYRNIQLRVRRRINKLWIRPDTCPICWYKSDIVAHHPDYNKRYEIVFCCKSCHRFIHNGTIECPETIDVLHYNK